MAIERVVDGYDDAATGTGFGNLNHGHDIRHVIHARTAVFRGDRHAHDAHFAELPANLLGVAVCMIEISRDRFDFGLGKFPDHVSYH